MSDLIDEPHLGLNDPEFSVSEISGAIKRVIEGEFSHVRIRGEVGRVSFPRSGHVYLDLKDDKAVISAVIWKGVASRLIVQPEEGMEVVATGRVTTFGGQSKYQLVIEDIKPAGVGALMAMLEKRKQMLSAEGLFDPSRKKQIPYLPEVIGVVTSPSGAVIRDILHRLRDRFPRKVLIWPVAVQGDKCAPDVARAIAGFNAFTPGGALPRPDLLIVARGGGSLEDLWGFNEEIVARAVAASDIPLISAVGHETDTTLIDYVSDKRAPTPTAAAEMAVPVRLELSSWLQQQGSRLTSAQGLALANRSQRLRDVSRALPRIETLLETPRQKLDFLSDRLPAALQQTVQKRRVTLSERAGSLRPSLMQRLVQGESQRFRSNSQRLDPSLLRAVAEKSRALESRSARLQSHLVTRKVTQDQKDLSQISARFADVAARQVKSLQDKLISLDRLRETMGYTATLKRGYAVVRSGETVVTSKAEAKKADVLEIQFADGVFELDAKPKSKKTERTPPPEQGSLF